MPYPQRCSFFFLFLGEIESPMFLGADLRSAAPARAAEVKDGRRPPPEAARSVLDEASTLVFFPQIGEGCFRAVQF
jgi:hypothetical protein